MSQIAQLPPAGLSRRSLLTRAGLAGAAAVAGAGLADTAFTPQSAAMAAPLRTRFDPSDGNPFLVNDTDILQFALNTEYVEAEFFLRAVSGNGLPDASTTGVGGYGANRNKTVTPGTVVAPAGPVPWENNATGRYLRQFFEEVAAQETAHLNLLRTALGRKVPARPNIDLTGALTTAMTAAGVIGAGQTFNPYENQRNFILAAFFFNDIGVTAYVGAAPYLTNAANLANAAGILGVESYHAGESRTLVYAMGQGDSSIVNDADRISSVRNGTAALSGAPPLNDEGVIKADGTANIIPTDANSLAFARGFPALLSLFYLNQTPTLTPAPAGFTPQGLNSRIR